MCSPTQHLFAEHFLFRNLSASEPPNPNRQDPQDSSPGGGWFRPALSRWSLAQCVLGKPDLDGGRMPGREAVADLDQARLQNRCDRHSFIHQGGELPAVVELRGGCELVATKLKRAGIRSR